MNIVMMTNTFAPHVGGVARSVEAFTEAYRARGHRVLVVAPVFEDMPRKETDVVRVPALQNFNGSDFSVVLPIPGFLNRTVREFDPDVIHSHHPFLLGSTAMHLANALRRPLVFTHHTMYEQYTHYVPGNAPVFGRFVVRLSTAYANLCSEVFAPSESVADVLRGRGVTAPVTVVPTGVDVARFHTGDGASFRQRLGIPADAFVIGHLGRLAPEKNLSYLARALARFLASPQGKNAHALVVGEGPSRSEVEHIFGDSGVDARLHRAGILKGSDLVDVYHAMDVFAFASKSETQGMVLTEAMAAGVPVVALDALGVREVVREGENGRLLPGDASEADFAKALAGVAGFAEHGRARLRNAARATAERFSVDHSVRLALACYERVRGESHLRPKEEYNAWQAALRLLRGEWELLRGLASGGAATPSSRTGTGP